MSTENCRKLLLSDLLRFQETIPPEDLFPTLSPEATVFSMRDAYAFLIAACQDRGMSADVIWTIPYEMDRHLGHLDPKRIYGLTEPEIAELLQRLPRKPRFINAAPRTIKELTRILVEEFGGDAAAIWRGRTASQVRHTLQRVYGVGPGIANMTVLLIEKAFGIRFSDLDRPQMDIKPDVHTRRVLHRLGVAQDDSEQAAIAAARWLNPEFPGEIDGALWIIGRRWCRPMGPQCTQCPVERHCKIAGLA